jgi:ABC-type transport system substrate-binding protein
MRAIRISFFCLPLLVLGLAWWAAGRAKAVRTQRAQEWVAALPFNLPKLDPLQPRSEVEQQLVDLLYEPLFRLDPRGEIEPVLASHWDWSQQITFWFATAEIAHQAAEHLRALDADRWITLGLDDVATAETELRLRFANPTGPGPDQAVAELATFEPLPIQFVRVRVPQLVRSYHGHFKENAVEARHLRREWFDGDQTAELVICGSPGDAVEELKQYYAAQPDLQAEVSVLATVGALREPLLDFRLQEDRFWPDQTPVTVRDVIATTEHLLERNLAGANRESLRLIQNLSADGPHKLRVTYRKFNGAALCAWLHFPILPAHWLEAQDARVPTPPATAGGHPDPELPPGSGPFRLTVRRPASWLLDATPGIAVQQGRFRLQVSDSPLVTQVAFATGTIDLYWPPLERLPSLRADPALAVAATRPRSRLLVMWQARSGPLADRRVREALALGTDRPALMESLVAGSGGLHAGLFLPGIWFSQPQADPSLDPKRAAELLNQAGWLLDVTTNRRKKPSGPLKIELLTTSGNLQRERLAQLLAAQWEKLGIETVIVPLPWADLVNERLTRRRFDAAILGLDFETSWDQFPFWHSSQTGPGGLNFSGITDPEIDRLLEKLTLEFDPKAVPSLTRQLDVLISNQHPYLSLFNDQQPIALRRAALPVGFNPDGTGPMTLRQLLLRPPPPPADLPAIPMRLPKEPD